MKRKYENLSSKYSKIQKIKLSVTHKVNKLIPKIKITLQNLEFGIFNPDSDPQSNPKTFLDIVKSTFGVGSNKSFKEL